LGILLFRTTVGEPGGRGRGGGKEILYRAVFDALERENLGFSSKRHAS